MPSTKLLYLEDMHRLEAPATVIEVLNENEKQIVILNETIFYPQGGGQPYDQGIIESPNGKFTVAEVRLADGIVRHIGSFASGEFAPGLAVVCRADAGRSTAGFIRPDTSWIWR